MASRVDQLETTVNAVYGRLDLNTLSERAEKLRHQQEQLQQLQARRNEEHRSRSLQRVHMSASPLAASPSTIKATQPSNSQPLTSVPVNTLNSGQQFTTSTSIFGTPPRRLSSPHGSTTHPAGNHSVSPQSKSTYAKASDALARARQARATQYPSLFPPDPHPAHAPPQTPPTGRPTPPPPAGNSYFAQSRKISPTRKPDTSLNSSQNDHTREHRSGSPIPLGASLDGSLHFSQHTQSNATLAQNPSATTANHPSSKLDLSPQTLLEERRRLVAERAEEARVAAARIEALEKELTGMKTAALAGIDGKQSAAASRPEAKNSDGSPKATAKESMPSFPNSNSVFGEEEQGSAGAADDGTDKKAGSDGKKQQGGKRPSKEDRMAAVLSELQALQKQNQAMSSRLVQHEEAVTALHAITPKKASRTSTTPPRKRQAAGLGDSHNTALFTTPEKQAAHARYSPSSTSWSPSLIKIGAKADRSLRKPSEFQQASSEDWTKSKQSLDASRVKSRGRDVAKRPSETEKDNKGKRASTAVQRKSTSGSAGYAYTKKNLAEHRVKAKLTPRQSTDDLHKSSTLVSSLCIRVDTSDLPVRPTTSSATRVQRRTTSNLTAKKQATPWNPNTQPQPVILPPNRHRVTQRSQLSDTVTTVSGMATTPRDGTFKSVDTKADRLVIDATRQDTTTGHHETLTTVNRPPVGPRISNDRVREWGVEPAEEEDDDSQEDGSYELGAEQLILPLPACCKTLPLSDSGVSPYGLVQISHLHSVEVADHYAKWLTSVDASEQEEAIAILSILPLGSLPSEPAEALYSSVLDVLSRYDELPNSTIAQALRIVQLVTAGHGGFPSASAAFYVLSRILRSADHVALIPAVVNTYLSFGQRGLLVLLDEACCDPPSSDSAVHRQGVASGWNSLILTMIANKPAVLQSLVVPMVLRDLRDGTPERAEAACCVLMGLHRYKPPVLAQLGEALVAGKFDRRLACIAIRVIGGTESVSLLQSLTSHPSHRVRQAAVWGLGLHAPYHHDTNVDFEEAFRDHQPYPALPKLRSRSSVVVHADLASLQQQANPAHHPSTPILYFQPQVEPDCPPYVETHVICDPTVILSQCRTFAQNGVLDLSVGEHNPVAPPSPTSYPRHSFVALASALAAPSDSDLATASLFLVTFRPVTGGRGILTSPLLKWQHSLKPPHSPADKLPPISHQLHNRIVSTLTSTATGPGDSAGDVKVKAEALFVLTWFPPALVEGSLTALRSLLNGPHPPLRAGVVHLVSETVRRSPAASFPTDTLSLLTHTLSDTHPRVRLSAVIGLRCCELNASLLQMLLGVLRDGKVNRYQVAHTISTVVPKGVTSLINVANARAVDDTARKACLYGLGKVYVAAVKGDPLLEDSVIECLGQTCSDVASAGELREQALLSLGCLAGYLANPLAPATPARGSAEGDGEVSLTSSRIAGVAIDKAMQLCTCDEAKVRIAACALLALSGSRGFGVLQDVLLKGGRSGSIAARVAAAQALRLCSEPAAVFKAALLALNDTEPVVRVEAAAALLPCPAPKLAARLRALPGAQADDLRNLARAAADKHASLLSQSATAGLRELLTLL